MTRTPLAAILLLGAGLALSPLDGARAQQRIDDEFDHTLTGLPLTGAHQRVQCELCHVRGIFEGTPTWCAGCHTRGGAWDAGGKPPTHIPSTDRCGDCHITTQWAVARFDHTGILDGCFRCHNGSTAEGKSGNHIRSSNDCETCHRTLAWIPAGFDHAAITGNCFSCHNGSTATGKPGNHIPSSNVCEDCHDTRSWRVAGGFDHAGVTGNCISCHDGGTATGKPGNHIPSSNACEDCHDTRSWTLAGGFDHAGISGNCASCHNGSFAAGKPGGHFVTTLGCDACHSTTSWFDVRFTHSSPNYPGDHAGNPDCGACHTGNSQTIAWPFAAYRPDCAGCHAGDFKPGPHKKTKEPETLYSVSELRDCTGACHVYTDASLTTIEKRRSGEHRASGGGW